MKKMNAAATKTKDTLAFEQNDIVVPKDLVFEKLLHARDVRIWLAVKHASDTIGKFDQGALIECLMTAFDLDAESVEESLSALLVTGWIVKTQNGVGVVTECFSETELYDHNPEYISQLRELSESGSTRLRQTAHDRWSNLRLYAAT